jgi:hypothetical protein
MHFFAPQVHGVCHNDLSPVNLTVTYDPEPRKCLFHVVDLGAASCPALNGPAFRAAWGYAGLGDISRVSPVCNLAFGSLEAVLGHVVEPSLHPLSDMQSALYTLVFLASRSSLPWLSAALSDDLGTAIGGEFGHWGSGVWGMLCS